MLYILYLHITRVLNNKKRNALQIILQLRTIEKKQQQMIKSNFKKKNENMKENIYMKQTRIFRSDQNRNTMLVLLEKVHGIFSDRSRNVPRI